MKSMPLAFSNTQIYARKNLRMHLKKIRQREYSKLRAMVPSVAERNKVSKVTVIEEAIKYIDELHQALAERLQNQGVNNHQSTELNTDSVKLFVQSMMIRYCDRRPNSNKRWLTSTSSKTSRGGSLSRRTREIDFRCAGSWTTFFLQL
ncbi:hypothetical protein ScPMuIL_016210 [Solemya velum]